MGRQYKTMIERDDGWSDWISPTSNYRNACCDCGLVHELHFVATRIKRNKAGEVTGYTILAPDKYQVVYKARRNMRATAAKRRAKKYAMRERSG